MTWDQPPVSSVLGTLPFLVHFSRWLSGSTVFSCRFSLYFGTLSLCSLLLVAPIFPSIATRLERGRDSLCCLALKPELRHLSQRWHLSMSTVQDRVVGCRGKAGLSLLWSEGTWRKPACRASESMADMLIKETALSPKDFKCRAKKSRLLMFQLK